MVEKESVTFVVKELDYIFVPGNSNTIKLCCSKDTFGALNVYTLVFFPAAWIVNFKG